MGGRDRRQREARSCKKRVCVRAAKACCHCLFLRVKIYGIYYNTCFGISRLLLSWSEPGKCACMARQAARGREKEVEYGEAWRVESLLQSHPKCLTASLPASSCLSSPLYIIGRPVKNRECLPALAGLSPLPVLSSLSHHHSGGTTGNKLPKVFKNTAHHH